MKTILLNKVADLQKLVCMHLGAITFLQLLPSVLWARYCKEIFCMWDKSKLTAFPLSLVMKWCYCYCSIIVKFFSVIFGKTELQTHFYKVLSASQSSCKMDIRSTFKKFVHFRRFKKSLFVQFITIYLLLSWNSERDRTWSNHTVFIYFRMIINTTTK